MVGCPASGKSTFRKRYFEPHGYVAVNRDTMGTMQKCIKVITSLKCISSFMSIKNQHMWGDRKVHIKMLSFLYRLLFRDEISSIMQQYICSYSIAITHA